MKRLPCVVACGTVVLHGVVFTGLQIVPLTANATVSSPVQPDMLPVFVAQVLNMLSTILPFVHMPTAYAAVYTATSRQK